jgi:hypothetical protein
MSESFPSKPIVSIDVPEVKRFKGKFVYNYFTPDERVSEDGSVPQELLEKPTGTFGQTFIDKFTSKVPRLVQLQLRPVFLKSRFRSDFAVQKTGATIKTSLSKNLDKIHSEREFSNAGFSGVGFQDTGIDGKLYLITSGTLAKRINSKNDAVLRKIDDSTKEFLDAFESNKVSLQDAAKFLTCQTGKNVSSEFVIDTLNDLKQLGARFISGERGEEIVNKKFDEIKLVDVKMKINNKILSKALKTSSTDSMSIFSDELEPLLEAAESIQKDAVRFSDPSSIDAAEYEITVDFLSRRKVSINSFSPTAKILGYVVDKCEVTSDNQVIEHDPIVVENPFAYTVTDFNVAYGAVYAYAVRSVAEVEFLVTDEDTDEFYAAKVLVSSSPSSRIVIECTESVPPPPPSDFNVSWDYSARRPRLMWCFPTNTQRDIKYWQIFRRFSINEPYHLLKQYDFDNSEIPTPGLEEVNVNLIEKMSSPKNFYIDEEFSKDSKAMYAICSIDAHGLSSTYSVQFEISFDRHKNKIVKRLVSASGAPKPYPNMYLNEDTFADVVKDSRHSRVTVYYDPEYLRVFNQVGDRKEDVGLLATKQNGGSYRMQFINTDLQKSAAVDIIIDELSVS